MRTGTHAAMLFALLVAAPVAPAAAQGAADAARPDVRPLKAGQYVWHETPARIAASTASEPLSIVVSLLAQRAYLYRGGRLLAETTVSTGAPGHDTPTGEFTILQKRPFHRSNLYSNAPMPHMQRLTWDGIALHGGHLPGYPASHGCIRLPAKFARQLYGLTEIGGKVTIVYDLMEAIEPYAAAQPIAAETRGLGGGSYDMLTMPGEPPSEASAARRSSWAAGPADGAPRDD